ncbi:MAG: glycosyltransferase, partial [Bacilli bacterium]
MKVFQRALFNTNEKLCDIREMYFRTDSEEKYNSFFLLNKGQFFETSTYFNSLSVEKIKKYTNIKDVSLQLDFKGSLKLSFFHINSSMEYVKLLEADFNSTERLIEIVRLDAWGDIESGIVYFRIDVYEGVELFDFCYATESVESQSIKLAIVITHFNRQNYLLPALKRIQADIINNYENIDVIVSDNSQNLGFEDNDRIKVYKNKNYGGSGGFSFGLLKAMEKGYTHCLFMDDDASTEMESILRTYSLLSFLKDVDSAILGAMLFKERKNIQHENGSKCRNGFVAIHNQLNLNEVKDILVNNMVEEIEFGGWWFFAFKVSTVKHMPFPFFVRGDDVSFSLANNFNIITFNGIASWQEDFNSKHNSYLEYLNIRSSFVMNLTRQFDSGVKGFIKLYLKTFLGGLLTYRYNSCMAAHFALNDILKGRIFWIKNIDMKEKRDQIRRAFVYEKVLKNERKLEIQYTHLNRKHESKLKAFIRIMLLNGILLPKILQVLMDNHLTTGNVTMDIILYFAGLYALGILFKALVWYGQWVLYFKGSLKTYQSI